MSIRPLDAHLLCRQLASHTLNGELEELAPEFRGLAAVLNVTAVPQRPAVLEAFLGVRDDFKAILAAILKADPDVPPEVTPTVRFATLADIRRDLTGLSWNWPGYIPANRVMGLAAYEGVGKTRTALDWALRIWEERTWPDGQPATFPKGTPTLWVCSDGQQEDLAETAAAFGVPDEAVILNTTADEPYGGTDIDDPEALARMEAAIVAHRPGLVFVDTLTNATARDLCRANEVKELGTPLRDLARRTRTSIVLMMHLSKEGKALGRRIRGLTRTLLHLDCPDPEHQPGRLKLWADKTFAKPPPALGVTMGETGNTYDFDPPKAPEGRRAGRPPEEVTKAIAFLVEKLSEADRMGCELIDQWQEKGGSKGTLFNAKRLMEADGRLVVDDTVKPQVWHLVRPEAAEVNNPIPDHS